MGKHGFDGQVVPDWEQRSLKHEAGYHWEMGRDEAEKLLKESEDDCCYIIRYCRRCKAYRLSVKAVTRAHILLEHYTLHIKHKEQNNTNVYNLKGKKEKFTKISHLLAHYNWTPIGRKFKNIGVPVPHEEGHTPKWEQGKQVCSFVNVGCHQSQAYSTLAFSVNKLPFVFRCQSSC